MCCVSRAHDRSTESLGHAGIPLLEAYVCTQVAELLAHSMHNVFNHPQRTWVTVASPSGLAYRHPFPGGDQQSELQHDCMCDNT